MVLILDGTKCPGSSDPFDTVTYYINGTLLPGQWTYGSSEQYFIFQFVEGIWLHLQSRHIRFFLGKYLIYFIRAQHALSYHLI